MEPSEALSANRVAIRRVVESHRARNARVFGSVLRGQDTPSSDLDILIDPTPETTLFDIGAIRHELGKLLGVPVDVLTPDALPAVTEPPGITGFNPASASSVVSGRLPSSLDNVTCSYPISPVSLFFTALVTVTGTISWSNRPAA